MSSFIDDMMLSVFFGVGPIPPESVARRILGLNAELPLNVQGIKSAFRWMIRATHPDLTDRGADTIDVRQVQSDEKLRVDVATRMVELVWARDDLLHRCPPEVMDNETGSSGGALTVTADDSPPVFAAKMAEMAARNIDWRQREILAKAAGWVDNRGNAILSPCIACSSERLTQRYVHHDGAVWSEGGKRCWIHNSTKWRGLCYLCASDAENEVRRKKQAERRLRRRAGRVCVSCGSVFTPPRSDGRYCSPACRQRAHRARVTGNGGARRARTLPVTKGEARP